MGFGFLEYVKDLSNKRMLFLRRLKCGSYRKRFGKPKQNEGEHGFTKEERDGIDNIIKTGFVDTFRNFTPEGKGHYTWWSHFANARARNIGWRLDYFL